MEIVRPEAQPFRIAWAKAFDDDVGLRTQGAGEFDAGLGLEVCGDRAFTPVEDGVHRLTCNCGRIEANHLGAHICQHHCGEGIGADSAEVENAHAFEHSHDFLSSTSPV